MLGLKGASSKSPCPWCKLHRERITNPACLKGNSVQTLKDYDQFYEKGEPRQLSDWNTTTSSDLRPINPVLVRLMIASDIQRIDEIIVVPCLHLKLRKDSKILLRFFIAGIKFESINSYNRLFENSIDPTKWIINFKHKHNNGSFSREEKQLENACHEIERYVVEVKPRRHGSGSDFFELLLTASFNNEQF